METVTVTSQSYLTFRLDDELFATSVADVSEILELSKITKVPRAPHFMRGVINLRGTVLPVVDTRLKFGLEKTPDTVNTCILVLNLTIDGQQIMLGAVVDSVQEVLEIDAASVQPAPSIGSRYKSGFISGMVKHHDQFIMLLHIGLVFSTEELSILQNTSDQESITHS
ncbi:chemotaxis protein CheW [Fulvivirgaceae bacterium PWU5]|uniref:Chemotaxis protein CheW n=1 Tax=Dawidia cretensis TaxID=2782350 RepID=A0AAP2GVE5_9BACT|nr:chemotaxis protein CheW [Dawidia cretensis]MBT1708882.1 chemotaxis protein CheW [Dawidia cretensis]